MNDFIFEGKIWVITDKNGKLIDDIDTDQIFHNAYLHITEIEKMGQYAFENLEGWRDFSKKVQSGDMIIAGRNFGSGSSRQQAVDCFKALGVKLIIAQSFGAIYKRNAINSGFPILVFDKVEDAIDKKLLNTGDNIKINLLTGELENLTLKNKFNIQPFSKVQKDIFEKKSLLKI